MGLFNTDNMIDEAKLAQAAVAALFSHLREEPLLIEFGDANPTTIGGSVAEAIRGLSIKISLGVKP